MSVAFVPLEQVLNCLQDLVQDSQTAFLVRQYPAIADFLFYFRRTWIDTFDPKLKCGMFSRDRQVSGQLMISKVGIMLGVAQLGGHRPIFGSP